MRILITNTGSWGTGSFTVVNAIVNELEKLGHDVKVFFPDNGQESPDKDHYYRNSDLYDIWRFPVEYNGTKIPSFPLMIPDPHPRNVHPITFKELSDDQLQLYFDTFRRRIKFVIEHFQPDVIECQHIWVMNHIIHQLGHPYIAVAHHSDQMGFHYDERIRKVAIQSAKDAKYLFAISEHVKHNIMDLYDVPEEKIIMIPNGYDQAVFQPNLDVSRKDVLKRLGLQIPDDAMLINFTGKLSFTKGIDTIVRANEIINNKLNVHFLLFGAGNIEDVINLKALNPKHTGRLHFVGHQPARLLAKAHNISKMNLAPSRHEGFSISALEAMGCGLPVIGTKGTSLDELAIGELIESANPQALADAILHIANLPENEYNALSQKALEKATQYTWPEIVKKRIEYYERMKE